MHYKQINSKLNERQYIKTVLFINQKTGTPAHPAKICIDISLATSQYIPKLGADFQTRNATSIISTKIPCQNNKTLRFRMGWYRLLMKAVIYMAFSIMEPAGHNPESEHKQIPEFALDNAGLTVRQHAKATARKVTSYQEEYRTERSQKYYFFHYVKSGIAGTGTVILCKGTESPL